MTVLAYPTGKPLNWAEILTMPNRAILPVMWSQKTNGGHLVQDCLYSIAQLDWMNEKAKADFGAPIDLIQSMNNEGVSASEGTHDYGFCRDWWILGRTRDKANGLEIVHWARFECFTADWLRTPEQGFSYHIHGFPYPPDGRHFPVKVGEYVDGGLSLTGHIYTSSQLADSWINSLGLKGQHNSGQDPVAWPSVLARTNHFFDLDAYIRNEMEKDMPSPKDWDADDWAAVKEFLETEPMIDLKDENGKVKKTISITDALQREVNG